MKRGRLIATALIGAIVLTAGGLGWRAVTVRNAVASWIPPLQARAAETPELEERIRRADMAARGFVRPVKALAELSRLYHANGFFDEALQCYEGLRRLEPEEAKWSHRAAMILATQGRLEEAEPLFARAVELAPDYVPARLRRGEVLLKMNRRNEARAAYLAVLERGVVEPYAMLGLARGAVAADDWQEAREWLQKAVATDPEFVGGLSLLVTVHEHFNEGAAAAEVRGRIGRREFTEREDPWMDELIESGFDPYQLSVRAAVVKARGDAAVARRHLERAVAYAKNAAPYLRQLGRLEAGEGNAAAARNYFERATALAPTDADAWVSLVNLLVTSGQRGEAYRKVAAGLERCPDSWALHFAQGKLLHEDGQLQRAIVELREAKRLKPSEANPYVELALVYFKFGDVEAGVGEMRAALVAQPDQPLALVVVARDAVNRGDAKGAGEWIRRIRQQPGLRRDDLQMVEAEFRQRFGRNP